MKKALTWMLYAGSTRLKGRGKYMPQNIIIYISEYTYNTYDNTTNTTEKNESL